MTFQPLPNSATGVERVRPRKAELYDLIADLHDLHLTSGVIGKILGLDRGYVRDILHNMGLHQHWSEPADVIASLPLKLRHACLRLTTTVDKDPSIK